MWLWLKNVIAIAAIFIDNTQISNFIEVFYFNKCPDDVVNRLEELNFIPVVLELLNKEPLHPDVAMKVIKCADCIIWCLLNL
jgi:hypothetical protein